MIYLDNSATSFPKPETVYDFLDRVNREFAFNPGRGRYRQAVEAAELIENARHQIAYLGECKDDQVIFTPSATQALNQIIFGSSIQKAKNIYISPYEHNAIVRPLSMLKDCNIIILPVDHETGLIDLPKTNEMFYQQIPDAVFVSEISNVTGIAPQYSGLFKMAKEYDAVTILDSSQAFGLINGYRPYTDFLVFDGHKTLYAAQGVGGYINYSKLPMNPLITGGTGTDSLNPHMPDEGPIRFEAGTPNVSSIASLIPAVDFLKAGNYKESVTDLAAECSKQLRKIPNIKVFNNKNANSLGIVSFAMDGYSSEELASILSEDFNIAVRGGYHCSPIIHDYLGSKSYNGTVRASFGVFNTLSDIEVLTKALQELSEEIL